MKRKTRQTGHDRVTLAERDSRQQQQLDNEARLIVKSELERNVKVLDQINFELRSSDQSLRQQMQLKVRRMAHESDLAMIVKK
jgi:hypothetical protein